MLRFYTIPVSLYSAKTRILLRHKRLQWEEVPPPGGYGSDEYKNTVPSGNIPAMVDGDLQLADSEAIAEYLNERHPHPPMLPLEPAKRSKVRERSRFHDTRLEPEVRVLFAYLDGTGMDAAVAAKQSDQITQRLNQLATMLMSGGGDQRRELTLADCGFPITFTWIDVLTPVLGLTVHWPSPIMTYREWLSEQEAVAQELESYRPALENWLSSEHADQ